MNIYVGNLSPQVKEEDLQSLFSEFGQVSSVKIISDMFSGESRGFAFVEMRDKAAAQKAIEALNTKEVKGKKITVNEARPKADNRRRGGGGGGGNRGGGGGGGRRW
ncbi:MAG: RNA-binding protein [Bacteroidetes bacterium]|nr:RNA-binding protein [Bacteroidota bacterium]MCL6099697.1 RNA-binding protein [Bacteroidota bacterium]